MVITLHCSYHTLNCCTWKYVVLQVYCRSLSTKSVIQTTTCNIHSPLCHLCENSCRCSNRNIPNGQFCVHDHTASCWFCLVIVGFLNLCHQSPNVGTYRTV